MIPCLQPTVEKGENRMNPSASQHEAPAIEDVIIGQIDMEMRELVFSSQEEEQGYFYSRYCELMTA